MRFRYTLHWNHEGRWRPRTETIQLDHPDPDDIIIKRIRNTRRFYETDLLEHIAIRGPSGGMFLDVGANIGNHTVYFAKFLADYVVAVEPGPAAADQLAANLAANGIENARILRCGVGAQEGRALPSESPGNLGATRLEVVAAGDEPEHAIPLSTIDALMAELPEMPVRFMKIDVEGMELDVLRGAAGLLERQRPQLCVELIAPEQYELAAAFLADLGYRVTGRFCATPTYTFADPEVHVARRRPPQLLYKLVRSWDRGKLSTLFRQPVQPPSS